LPSEAELKHYLDTNFRGTRKDFSHVIALLGALGIGPGQRVLDYGANWGYCTLQLRRAGYAAEAFEISRSRAAFGLKLGIEIRTTLDGMAGQFDAVYSGHVLEHVPDPRAALVQQLECVRPGGFVLAHTPNGSEELRRSDFPAFHLHWGQVHPVLLGAEFIRATFPHHPFYLSASSDPGPLKRWSQRDQQCGPLDGRELFIVIRRCDL
jgi:2-polyprenyl-3-methyl-5-hydroxy-6-metoxy-1,4-benzoquinol methylase